MTTDEARELRAAIAEVLDPLYAARLGNLRPDLAVESAILRLQRLDEVFRGVANGTAAERSKA
ncbi:MAG TPA: hypothetical protein VIL85_11835 [Thermomicrobiales bacterium]|jgi:hypothetical protein